MNGSSASIPTDAQTGVPLVDLHAHLEGLITAIQTVEIARARGVRLGIVEHGGRGWHLDAVRACDLGPEHIFLPGREKG